MAMRSMLLLALLLGSASLCRAAPEEIQVYMDDMTKPGRFGTDFHNNFVPRDAASPDYQGARDPDHVYRFTPEFYYGLTPRLELGAYLLSALDKGGHAVFDGSKLRLKFIAPHDETSGPFWGANLEAGRTRRDVSEDPWNTELKGIYGYRLGPWTFAVNPNLDSSLNRPQPGACTAEIDTKVSRQVTKAAALGFESYDELGPLRAMSPANAAQTLYAAFDAGLGHGLDLNAGVGRGLTSAADQWTLKFILGVHY